MDRVPSLLRRHVVAFRVGALTSVFAAIAVLAFGWAVSLRCRGPEPVDAGICAFAMAVSPLAAALFIVTAYDLSVRCGYCARHQRVACGICLQREEILASEARLRRLAEKGFVARPLSADDLARARELRRVMAADRAQAERELAEERSHAR